MKRLTLTIIAALAFLTATAQNATILLDKPASDGSRLVSTDYILCRNGMKDTFPLQVALSCHVSSDGGELWSLDIRVTFTSSFTIPKGGRMLILLDSGETIELEQALPDHDTEDVVGTYSTVTKMRTHNMHGAYPIPEDDVQKIALHAVTKVRVEKFGEPADNEYKSDKIGSVVRAEYSLIRETLATEKDFYDGF